MNAPWRRTPGHDPDTEPRIQPPKTEEEKAEERKAKTKERNERYRAKNPHKVKEWQRTQYLKNREKRLAYAKANSKERAARDPGGAIARRVLLREKDLPAARQREKEYRERNVDRVRELAKARTKRYREVHAEDVRARQRLANRETYATNRDEINAKRRAAYAARKAGEQNVPMADDIG